MTLVLTLITQPGDVVCLAVFSTEKLFFPPALPPLLTVPFGRKSLCADLTIPQGEAPT